MKTANVSRESLIAAGVRNLKEFGYPSVNTENILTDMVFSKFFASMLEDYPQLKTASDLLAEIKSKETP